VHVLREEQGILEVVGLTGIFSIVGLAVLWFLPDKLLDDLEARMPARKIWGLVCMVLGLGLTLVSSLLEEDAMQRYKNFQSGLGGLALILFIVSLVMLFYKRK